MPLLVCPNCNVGMTVVQREGVEIDMCPQCRGVWLDRGELEKLLEPIRHAVSDRPGGFLQPDVAEAFLAGPGPAREDHGGHGPYGHDEHHQYHGHGGKHSDHDKHGYHAPGHSPGHSTHGGWRRFLDVFD